MHIKRFGYLRVGALVNILAAPFKTCRRELVRRERAGARSEGALHTTKVIHLLAGAVIICWLEHEQLPGWSARWPENKKQNARGEKGKLAATRQGCDEAMETKHVSETWRMAKEEMIPQVRHFRNCRGGTVTQVLADMHRNEIARSARGRWR